MPKSLRGRINLSVKRSDKPFQLNRNTMHMQFFEDTAHTHTPLRNEKYVNILERWISTKMKVWHPWQLKKSKYWGPFWSYQLNSTANSAHLAHFMR